MFDQSHLMMVNLIISAVHWSRIQHFLNYDSGIRGLPIALALPDIVMSLKTFRFWTFLISLRSKIIYYLKHFFWVSVNTSGLLKYCTLISEILHFKRQTVLWMSFGGGGVPVHTYKCIIAWDDSDYSFSYVWVMAWNSLVSDKRRVMDASSWLFKMQSKCLILLI